MDHSTAMYAGLTLSPTVEAGIAWFDVRQCPLEGKGWDDTLGYYHRLPARAQGVVRDVVWDLSRQSAGLLLRFETDSPVIHARYTLTQQALASANMSAIAVSGLDLYCLHQGHWRWVEVTRPESFPEVHACLVEEMPSGKRTYMLYLPLYNGIEQLEIGVRPDAEFHPLPPSPQPPIAYYGTSIAQGGSASRAGMAFISILGRRLNRPMLNLGFSGNGQMEPEMAELFCELNPAIYVLDTLPNMHAAMVAERAEPFIRRLRAAHPETPIVLVEDRAYPNSIFFASKAEHNAGNRAEYRRIYEALVEDGMAGLYYVPGDPLLHADGEDTIDGSHPTDRGMVRYADVLEPVLRALL